MKVHQSRGGEVGSLQEEVGGDEQLWGGDHEY